MKEMKKILMIIVCTFAMTMAYGKDIKLYNNSIVADSISKITVDFPSTIRVFESENEKTFMLIRSDKKWLLDSIIYNIEDNKLHIKSKDNTESIMDNDVIIYLYSPQNVDFNTSKYGLFVNVQHKNTKLTNNEKQN